MATPMDVISSQRVSTSYNKKASQMIWIILVILIVFAFMALNYRQLGLLALTNIEKFRLEQVARTTSWEGFTNPSPMQDGFDSNTPSDFWRTMFIMGKGIAKFSTNSWHAASYEIANGQLTLYNYPDPSFDIENGRERYNNIAFFGASGFMPTPAEDVVVEWKMIASENFMGSAGLTIEPDEMHDETGFGFNKGKKYDMFILTILAPETNAFYGTSGALCIIALDQAPSYLAPIPNLDFTKWHDYKLRMRWVDQVTWEGVVSVDGTERCSLKVPPLGKTEIQLWKDNHAVQSFPKQWYEISPGLDIGYQNTEKNWVRYDDMRIYAEKK